MSPRDVMIVDSSGKVLSKVTEGGEMALLSNSQIEYKKNVEKELTNRITSMVANAPLSAEMVTSAQSVRKGKKVLLVIDAPGFRITTTGETQESAPVGNHVRVVNQTTRKTMTGLLIDDATVKVDF